MKYISVILLLFISCNNSYNSVIKRCKDVDTYVLSDNRVVRLAGCDGVELHQQLGYEAKAFAENFLLNKTVCIIPQDEDRYGREVSVVIVNGQDFADILVKNGFAVAYKQYATDKIWNEYQTAVKEKRGLFAYSNWETPYSFRKRTKNRKYDRSTND